MDGSIDKLLAATGLLAMVGKAEGGPAAIDDIVRHCAPYPIAVDRAAHLISKFVKAARVVAFEDLGMEAIHEIEVDVEGRSIHRADPVEWRGRMSRMA
jgi:fumarate hydratase class I